MGHINGGRILLQVAIGPPGEVPPPNLYTGLLDTGATKSGITSRVVEILGLESDGEWASVVGVHGPQDVPTYRVALVLPISEGPDGLYIKGSRSLEVSELSVNPDLMGFDVLLGMDFLHPFHLTVYRDNFILSN